MAKIQQHFAFGAS